MKILTITILSVVLLSLNQGCSPANGGTNDAKSNSNTASPKVEDKIVQSEPELWIPRSVEKCIETVSVGETIEPEKSANPYYLRVDFDGNSMMDLAVLIRGVASKKRGVILCRNESAGSLHGPIAGSKSLESENLDISFVTENWEAVPASEARNPFVEPGKKVKTDAKGEAIVFVFEGGGAIYLFWDGQQFRLFDGI